MANLIQVKRSTVTDAPASGGLVTGELAYSLLNTSNSLFIGDGSNNAIRIGGGKYLWLHQANVSAPGAITSNAVVITNGNGYVTEARANKLVIGTDGTATNITSFSITANTTRLGASAGGSNTEIASTWAVKTYVDGQVAAAIPVLTDTYVGFGNSSNYLGGVSAFTFTTSGNTLSVGSVTVNGASGTVNASAVNASGDVTVGGNLTVSGTLTTINTTNLNISDPLIRLANNNDTADIVDIGLFGSYGNSTVTQYSGLFRDASDGGIYKLFKGAIPAPGTTVDTANVNYDQATLATYLYSGALTTNSSIVAIQANTTVNVNITANLVSTGVLDSPGFYSNSTSLTLTANSTLSVGITANTLTLSSALVGTSGGTGLNSYTAEQILVANSSNGFRTLSAGANGTVLQITGGVVEYNTLDGGTF